MPQPIEFRALRLSLTSFTVMLLPRRPAFPMRALAIPGPKPARRLCSLLKAFSVGSAFDEFNERPPGIQALVIFLVAETRAGVGVKSIEADWRQKLWPVLFIMLVWCFMGEGVARGDTYGDLL